MKKPIFPLVAPDFRQSDFFYPFHAKNQIFNSKYHLLVARNITVLYFFETLKVFFGFLKKLIKVWIQFLFFVPCFFNRQNKVQTIGASAFFLGFFRDNVYNLSYALNPCYGCYGWDIFVPPPKPNE